jgi:hypothetical protein
MWMFAVAALLLLLVAGVISYPLLAQRLESYTLAVPDDEPYGERDALLEALGDLEDSFRAGKLSQPDFDQQRGRLERRYLDVVEGGEREA